MSAVRAQSTTWLESRVLLMDFVYLCLRMRADEQAQYTAFTGLAFDAEDVALMLASKAGPKWVLMQGDPAAPAQALPLAVGGFEPLGHGIYQDFLLGTDEAWTHQWRTVSKHCRRVMDKMLEQPEVRRIQCIALASRKDARRWYKVLGYQFEGVLRAYGVNGEDAAIYSRVRT